MADFITYAGTAVVAFNLLRCARRGPLAPVSTLRQHVHDARARYFSSTTGGKDVAINMLGAWVESSSPSSGAARLD